ncbi:MAG: hypothetical protein JRD94_17725 [Deltaproteobacteria bacterium]|nr:hypothetical protein [Deltaproteobacteria bacterium]
MPETDTAMASFVGRVSRPEAIWLSRTRPTLRGTAYGSYHAVLGIIDLPASLIAGVLWQGVGSWSGFGPAAPFYVGAGTALTAALLFAAFVRDTK